MLRRVSGSTKSSTDSWARMRKSWISPSEGLLPLTARQAGVLSSTLAVGLPTESLCPRWRDHRVKWFVTVSSQHEHLSRRAERMRQRKHLLNVCDPRLENWPSLPENPAWEHKDRGLSFNRVGGPRPRMYPDETLLKDPVDKTQKNEPPADAGTRCVWEGRKPTRFLGA